MGLYLAALRRVAFNPASSGNPRQLPWPGSVTSISMTIGGLPVAPPTLVSYPASIDVVHTGAPLTLDVIYSLTATQEGYCINQGLWTMGIQLDYTEPYPNISPSLQYLLAFYGNGSLPPNPVIRGCTDPAATNYNPLATVDDGSCTFTPPITGGCTNPAAWNYNPMATTDDGSCILPPPPRRGCTDPVASNYDPMAVLSDGSCQYPVPVVIVPAAPVDPCACHWAEVADPANAWALTPGPSGVWTKEAC